MTGKNRLVHNLCASLASAQRPSVSGHLLRCPMHPTHCNVSGFARPHALDGPRDESFISKHQAHTLTIH